MIVLVAGPSRTGSMWTYNVTRSLLLAAGKNILPHDAINDVAAVNDALADAANMAPGDAYCIKAHVLLKQSLPVKIINNYRDVRDAMLSYMRFMKQPDFEMGLQFARSVMAETEHYFQRHRDNIIRIKYDDLIADPLDVIGKIDEFLALGVAQDEMRAIAERFARHKVRELVKGLEQVAVNGTGEIEGEVRDKYLSVANSDGSYRVFDKETNFQTNHISSNKPGEWREVFTPEQQERLLRLTADWLERYGFEI